MKTRIICIRMPEELIQKLDTLSKHGYNFTRSKIAVQLLNVLTDCADYPTLFKMINSWDAYGQGYVVRFGRPQK